MSLCKFKDKELGKFKDLKIRKTQFFWNIRNYMKKITVKVCILLKRLVCKERTSLLKMELKILKNFRTKNILKEN